jgi:hypothetical protein
VDINGKANYEEVVMPAHKKGMFLLKLHKDGFEKTYKIIVR